MNEPTKAPTSDHKSITFILSAKECDPELQAEFGASLPACMVPLGSRTLLHAQLEEAYRDPSMVDVYVAVPHGTDVKSAVDIGYFPPVGVSLFPMDTSSIDETFQNLFEVFIGSRETYESVFQQNSWRIYVLNGDTLIQGLANLPVHGNTSIYDNEETTFSWSRNSEDGQVYTGCTVLELDFGIINSDVGKPLSKRIAESTQCLLHSQSESIRWLDFGHVHTYYRSKRKMLTGRAFNTVKLTDSGMLIKRGQPLKIQAELSWYETAQTFPQIRTYLPQTRPNGDGSGEQAESYQIEYLACPTLAELLVFGSHGKRFWTRIAEKLMVLLNTFHEIKNNSVLSDPLLLEKSAGRVKNLVPALRGQANVLIDHLRCVKQKEESTELFHGDLCFSNVLYDARTDRLKVIDPRGLDTKGPSVWGSQLYDLAKLYHSSYGLYDFILSGIDIRVPSGPMSRKEVDPINSMIEERIRDMGYTRKDLLAITSLMFYSMLPLHSENRGRCRALADRAQALYDEFQCIRI